MSKQRSNKRKYSTQHKPHPNWDSNLSQDIQEGNSLFSNLISDAEPRKLSKREKYYRFMMRWSFVAIGILIISVAIFTATKSLYCPLWICLISSIPVLVIAICLAILLIVIKYRWLDTFANPYLDEWVAANGYFGLLIGYAAPLKKPIDVNKTSRNTEDIFSISELKSLSLKQLQKLARKLKIHHYKDLNTHELVKSIYYIRQEKYNHSKS